MVDQRRYWDRVADQKTFTHPINAEWLIGSIDTKARILDYGCGYGRSLNELASLGYTNTLGVDFAPRMIARGKRSFPKLDLRLVQGFLPAEADASFDAILLLAVLTCIPVDEEQSLLVGELRRLLRPGGVLYISDMPLQSDGRNLARYATGKSRFGTYGVFETEDGAIVRHYDDQRLDALLEGFEKVAIENVRLITMNGNAATGVQILARCPTL
jgi:SAM-dependent methyltransferase